MVNLAIQLKASPLTQAEKNKVIIYFKQAVTDGKHWCIALLESIQLWTEAEESYNGRIYRYLIAGEAFDWLLLADSGQWHIMWFEPDDCGLESNNVVSFADNVVWRPPIESINVVEKSR